MERFHGRNLAPRGRIAVISNDALGNFVVVTPLLQMLKHQYQPSSLDYFGGNRVVELQRASKLIDFAFPFHGSTQEDKAQLVRKKQGYDLIVNVERSSEAKAFVRALSGANSAVCGPSLDANGEDLCFGDDDRAQLWQDPDWQRSGITEVYSFLKSPFIGEFFCRLAYLEGDIPPYDVPCSEVCCEVPEVLISTAASLPEKLWPTECWKRVCTHLKGQGLRVGVIGPAPAIQSRFWKGGDGEGALVDGSFAEDFRGRFTLPEVVGALRKAKLVVTLDNGILHLAVAARKPTVGIFRYGIHRLWAPPSGNLQVVRPNINQSVQDIPFEAVRNAVDCAL